MPVTPSQMSHSAKRFSVMSNEDQIQSNALIAVIPGNNDNINLKLIGGSITFITYSAVTGSLDLLAGKIGATGQDDLLASTTVIADLSGRAQGDSVNFTFDTPLEFTGPAIISHDPSEVGGNGRAIIQYDFELVDTPTIKDNLVG